MIQTSELLTVQKFVYLLDDFHYEQFTASLEETKSHLPLKLAQFIRKKLPDFDSHEALCKKIYGKYEKSERLNFNQLGSYTFKLSSHLAINYPAYLSPNYSLLQRLVNKGETEPANFLARLLLDVSEKIEDHATQIFVLKFFVQQAFLMKENVLGVKLSHQLDQAYQKEKSCMEILSALRLHLNIALKPTVDPEKLEYFTKMFQELQQNTNATIRLLAKYAYLYTLYYHLPEKFKEPSTNQLIKDLDKDINNNVHVVFPFAFDLRSNFNFYKLKSSVFDPEGKEGKRDFEDLEKHYTSVQFWNSYLNIPQMFSITYKTSIYLNKYHHLVHRTDYYKIMDGEDLKEINLLAARCREILNQSFLEKYYKNDLINFELLFSGLLILSGGAAIKQGAQELEAMLISYQQINLAGTEDSVFLFLMIAYFAMRSYDKCAATFKRYLRVTKGKPVYDDNDIEIYAYYYLSQWLALKNKQYLLKLKSTYNRAVKNEHESVQAKAIEEFISYFNLPVEL